MCIPFPTPAGDVYLADSAQVPRVHFQVHRGGSRSALGHGRGVHVLKLRPEEIKYIEEYLSGVNGVLSLDSGYLSKVGLVNIPGCSTYTKVLRFTNTNFNRESCVINSYLVWVGMEEENAH